MSVHFYQENISGENQPLRKNYKNLNMDHTILIQGSTQGRWRGDLFNLRNTILIKESSGEVGGVISPERSLG